MNRIFLLLLLTFSVPVWAMENLSQGDYLGDWKSREYSTTKERLFVTFSENSGFKLKRIFPTGAWQECDSGAEDVVYLDGVMLAHCNIAAKLGFKLVVSGYCSGETKIIFGMLYLYQDGVLYNGIPISLTQNVKKDNKPLNTEACDAGSG